MDLKEAWRKLDEEKLQQPIDENIQIVERSRHSVQKLINAFQVGLGLVVFYEVCFVYLFIIMPQLLAKVSLIFMMGVYFLYFIVNLSTLQKVKQAFRMDDSLAVCLRQIYGVVKIALSFQRKSSVIILPIAVIAGFLVGISINHDITNVMQQQSTQIRLLVAVLVIAPLGYLISTWLERKSYKQYLKKLRSVIDQFEFDKKISRY